MQIHSDYDIIKTIFSLRSDTLEENTNKFNSVYSYVPHSRTSCNISQLPKSSGCHVNPHACSFFTGEYSQSGGEWQMLDAKTRLALLITGL